MGFYFYIMIVIIVLLFSFYIFCSFYLIREGLMRITSKNKANSKKKELFLYSDMAYQKIKRNKIDNVDYLNKTRFDKVEINSYGYKLVADLFLGNSDVWVIMLHGYLGKKEEMLHMSSYYHKRGYNVLLPDLRSHGESAGTYIGMGYIDRYDILNWIKFITDKNKNAKIILHGHSMGAAAALFTAGEKPENLKCVISDSAYTSVYDIFKAQLKLLYQLPGFPLLDIASFIFKHFYGGYNFRKANVVNYTRNIEVPVLFIHGTRDILLSYKMCDTLYSTCRTSKDKRFFEAGHAQSELEDEEKYFDVIFQFIDKVIK